MLLWFCVGLSDKKKVFVFTLVRVISDNERFKRRWADLFENVLNRDNIAGKDIGKSEKVRKISKERNICCVIIIDSSTHWHCQTVHGNELCSESDSSQ